MIVDDCSTDGSLEFFQHYLADTRVTLLTSTRNSGSPFLQWMRGIEITRGDLIWIAESDDSSSEDFLKKMVLALSQTSATFGYCGSVLIDCDSQPFGIAEDGIDRQYPHTPSEDTPFILYDGMDFLRRKLTTTNVIPNVSACLFHKAPLTRHIGRIKEFHYIGDWHLYARLLTDGDVVRVCSDLNKHRQHPDTTRLRTRSIGEWGRILMEHAINGSFLVSEQTLSEEDFRFTQGRLAFAAAWDYWLDECLSGPGLLEILIRFGARRVLILGFGKIGQKCYSSLRNAGFPKESIVVFDKRVRRAFVGEESVEVNFLESVSVIHSKDDIIFIASFAYSDELENYIESLGITCSRLKVSDLSTRIKEKFI